MPTISTQLHGAASLCAPGNASSGLLRLHMCFDHVEGLQQRAGRRNADVRASKVSKSMNKYLV